VNCRRTALAEVLADPDVCGRPAFAPACEVIDRLAAAGHVAVLVGGCVRDLLLGRRVADIDVATDAPPERVEALFPRTHAVGRAFGVVVVVTGDGTAVEVATFRADGVYVDGRRPEAVRYSDEVTDVERRDFTINALVCDPLAGELRDRVGGREDLDAGLVRAVGDAAARIAEDRLRALRAVRFAARLGFALEAGTAAACDGADLAGLARERILGEWDKAMAADPVGVRPPARAAWIRLLAAHRLLAAVAAPLAPLAEEAAARLARIDLDLALDGDAATAVALAAADPAAAGGWIDAQPLARHRARRLHHLRAAIRGPWLEDAVDRRRLARDPDAAVVRAGWAASGRDADAALLDAAIAAETGRDEPVALLDGEDCRAAGLEGPAIGAALRAHRDLVWRDEHRDRDASLAWLADFVHAHRRR